jgi:DNA (cytosine-5)-methyltransferase 1
MPLGVAVQLLPTPVVNDMGAGKTPEAWDEWTEKMKAGHANGNGHGPSLSIEVARLPPTPHADFRDRSAETAAAKASGRDFFDVSSAVLSLGEPTNPPSVAGKPSSDDQLPGQLSLDATEND